MFISITSKKIFFSFSLLNFLNSETRQKCFGQKIKKNVIFFPVKNFVDKTIFNFHSFNKILFLLLLNTILHYCTSTL